MEAQPYILQLCIYYIEDTTSITEVVPLLDKISVIEVMPPVYYLLFQFASLCLLFHQNMLQLLHSTKTINIAIFVSHCESCDKIGVSCDGANHLRCAASSLPLFKELQTL